MPHLHNTGRTHEFGSKQPGNLPTPEETPGGTPPIAQGICGVGSKCRPAPVAARSRQDGWLEHFLATLEAPLDTPYGDRRAMVRDPYGNVF